MQVIYLSVEKRSVIISAIKLGRLSVESSLFRTGRVNRISAVLSSNVLFCNNILDYTFKFKVDGLLI